MAKTRGWKKESARHALASKGVKTKLNKKTAAMLKRAPWMKDLMVKQSEDRKRLAAAVKASGNKKPRIVKKVHDYFEVRFKGKKYSFDTFADALSDPEAWDKEMVKVSKMSMAQILKKYG